MATTPNIGLYKPTRDDYISVQRDLSNNYELIDSAVGQNNTVINDMDIIVNGNTASVNVTAGQFVTVRNSTIVGITDGIYKAKDNVASGTVFTSSNLENITGGALNALIERIDNLNNAIKLDFQFDIPANSSVILQVESSWSYTFLLCSLSPNSQAQTGVLHFISGYATASRGNDVNIGGNTIISIDMTSTTNKWITITNSNNAITTLGVINLNPLGDTTFSV